MAQYTICAAADLQLIADEYGLGQLRATSLLKGGQQNTNYLLDTTRGRFVYTITERHSTEKVEKLACLLQHLHRNGFPTSRVVPNKKGHYVTDWKGKPTMLKVYLEGEVITDLSDRQLQNLGQKMARLHSLPIPDYLPTALSYGRERFHELDRYDPGSDFQLWLQTVERYVEPYLKMDLPSALIHSDIFDNNLVVDPVSDSVIIMDFEEAAHYYRIFDLGMAMVGVCLDGAKVDLRKVRHLLAGYQTLIRLRVAERLALKPFLVYAAAAMSFWRHRNFNYYHPTPAKFHHYRALQEVAKAAWALPENSFLFD